MIDLTFRAITPAHFIAVATTRGVYYANGIVQPGFAVDAMGNVIISQEVGPWDSHRVPTVPAIADTWFWYNVRIYNAAATADADTLYPGDVIDGFAFTKSKLAAFVRNQATVQSVTIEGVSVTTYEFGAGANRIQLIDPRQYAAIKRREWAGGMVF